jgi:hypothetical protein
MPNKPGAAAFGQPYQRVRPGAAGATSLRTPVVPPTRAIKDSTLAPSKPDKTALRAVEAS